MMEIEEPLFVGKCVYCFEPVYEGDNYIKREGQLFCCRFCYEEANEL
jgi:hypothetical protein